MGMRQLESEILFYLRRASGVNKLRVKDLCAWSTGPVEAQEGEVLFHLPTLGVTCAVRRESLGKRWKGQGALTPGEQRA